MRTSKCRQLSGRVGPSKKKRRRLSGNSLGLESLESRHLLAAEPLMITEFMADNESVLRDRFRAYSDWVEVHNPTDQTVELDGWYLTDDSGDLTKWRFPVVSINPNGYTVVFASGEDRIDPDSQLHTNFKLGSGGDYLALVRPDLTVAHAFSPEYPAQFPDVSYGIVYDAQGPKFGQFQFFDKPTPEAANNSTSVLVGESPDVRFSTPRGFFNAPFDVTLSTENPAAVIRYTTNGSAPTLENGTTYSSPLTITTTTPLRVASFLANHLPGDVTSNTYIFPDDVIHKQDGSGLPEQWGYFDDQGPRRPARAKANYATDPDVANHADYKDTLKSDLNAVPTISLVMDPKDLWDFDNGIYSNPERTGDAWERPVSMEWLNEQGETEFHTDAGIRIHGGWARRFSQTKKFSFKVIFRSKYGDSTLDYPMFGEDAQTEFQSLVLRGGFNDSWRDTGGGDNTYMQDQWSRLAQRELGGYAPRDRYVHLYLNGLYWGMYSPTERMNAEWASFYMGGQPEEWDVINTGAAVVDGDTRSWTQLMRAVNRRPVDYAEVQRLLDVDDFINYFIVNQYIGNWDWPHNNWYASHRRVEGEKWRFHTWDAEAAFQQGIGVNRVNTDIQNTVGPGQVYIGLRTVPEFQRQFADHVRKHLYNDGALTPAANVARLNAIAAQMDRAIVGESLRWGDGRDDTGRPLTRLNWTRRVDVINRTYFPRRGDNLVTQYRAGALYPAASPPDIAPFGGRITNSTDILMTAPTGDIFYTIDGSDPLAQGGPSTSAIRLNSVDIVSGETRAKTLIPTGAASENGWQGLAYDDSAWTDSFASIGYDTRVPDDVIQVPNGFRVRSSKSSGTLDALENADAVLRGENVASTKTVENVPYLNYYEGTRDAHFDRNLPLPITGDHFAIEATGKMLVRKAGMYTLGLNRNDGVRLELDGRVLFADTERISTKDQFIPIQLTEGEHEIRITYYERTATAVLEFFYAPGEKTEFDDSFKLVGDLQHRPYGATVRTDLQERMSGKNASVYSRITFDVADPSKYDNLFLRLFHDDGYVAYLNGTEIARDNAPDAVNFNSSATRPRSDVAALTTTIFDVSAHKQRLRAGTNVLAFQTLNLDAGDPDLLMVPRLVGTISNVPIRLSQSSKLRARVELDGEWSAMTETNFRLSELVTADDVRVSEVHYHPRAATNDEIAAGFPTAQDFEFIEIVNVSDKTIDLTDVQFDTTLIGDRENGVAFSFKGSAISELKPGEYAVIVEDMPAFANRYGNDVPVAGEWSGALSNSTDTISLLVGESVVQRFAYDDRWYPETDGLGSSLEIKAPASTLVTAWENPASWRASVVDGTPGRASGNLPGDANRDGVFDETDLLLAFKATEYEDGVAGNSIWEEGDWDGDGEFTTRDLVLAFMVNDYVGQNLPAAVPLFVGDDDDLDESRSRRHKEDGDTVDSLGSSEDINSRDLVFSRLGGTV